MINSTTSMDFATFLCTTYREQHDIKFLGVQPVQPGSPKLRFIFDGGDAVQFEELERDFLNGSKACAVSMMATLRRIRKLMELEKAKQQATTTPQRST